MRIYQMSETRVPEKLLGRPITKHCVELKFYSPVQRTFPETGHTTYKFAECTLGRWLRDEFSTTSYELWWPRVFIDNWSSDKFPAQPIVKRLESSRWQPIHDNDIGEIPTGILAEGEAAVTNRDFQYVYLSDHHRWKYLDVADSFLEDLAQEYRSKHWWRRAQWFVVEFLVILVFLYWWRH